MTIAELIIKLQAYDSDLKVFVATDDGAHELVDFFETDNRASKTDDVIYLHIAEQVSEI